MKKVFNIIISLCVVVTIGLVAYNFLRTLEPSQKIYSSVYSFTHDYNNKNFSKELTDCEKLTKDILSEGTLTSEQLGYINELSECIYNLDEFNYSLSINLIFENKKTSKTAKITRAVENLIEERDKLMYELDVYQVKMSGNTYGDPMGTYSVLLNDIVNYIRNYNNTFKLLIDFILEDTRYYNQTCVNVFKIYSNALSRLTSNYDKGALYFRAESFTTIQKLNNLIRLDNNNLVTAVVGGVYSSTATLFNDYYNKINEQEFVSNFHKKNFETININTENDLETITYYYLIKLLEVA